MLISEAFRLKMKGEKYVVRKIKRSGLTFFLGGLNKMLQANIIYDWIQNSRRENILKGTVVPKSQKTLL